MKNFKMKDVEYVRKMLWDYNCMTKHCEWVAVLDGEWIAHDTNKTDLIERVRRLRKKGEKS